MLTIRISLISLLFLLLPLSAFGAGTSPREAYLEYHLALKSALSDEALWPHATKAAREEFERTFPPDFRGRAFYLMKAAAPHKVQVSNESIDGDTATLTLLPGDEHNRVKGTATLKREEGVWKVERVIWQGD